MQRVIILIFNDQSGSQIPVKCKHIFAVEISYALHKEVEVALN